MVITRNLTRSGLELSEIGLGCATLSFNAEPDAINNVREMFNDALNVGIRYFDTAPLYGSGLSERLVGDALRNTSATFLSTKAGRLLNPESDSPTHMPFEVVFDYTYDGIMRSVEHSYQRLGLSKIDILYCHDLGVDTHGNDAQSQFSSWIDGGGYRAMDELRRSGDVKAIGLGVNEIAICEQAMEHGSFDVFLLAGRHTLLERHSAQQFFERCAQAKTDLVIGGPFNSGMLVGGSTYNYRAIPENMSTRLRVLLSYCKEHHVDIGAAALHFPLRNDLVKSVIPGPKTRKELEQILSWYHTSIPESFWSGLMHLDDL